MEVLTLGKFRYSNKVFSFRPKFDLLDGENCITYEFAWPVEVIECQANKLEDDTLDALAEAALELLSVPNVTLKKVASLLKIGEEIINAIVKDLDAKKLYDANKGIVTKAGKGYITTREMDNFAQEKVFGNMFVSRVDGEVFPFFYEGKLPWQREYPDLLFLSFDEDSVNPMEKNSLDLVDKVNRAFHKYGMISKSSHENAKYRKGKEIDFIEEELVDASFSDVENESETLADKEETKSLKNARIKILKTRPKEAYVRCRVSVSKAAPEVFIVDSPFPSNITSWYSECFHRMCANNESIYLEDGEEDLLESFCDEITSRFYINFPELQANDFNQYIKINYPEM
jgi:hypothetical protein